MPLVGRFAPKVDARLMLVVGVTVVGASQLVGSHLTAAAGFGDLVMPQLIRAVGLAFIFIPVSVAALSDLSPAARGNATGLFNLTRELGGSLGTAWMGKVVYDGATSHASALAAHVTVFDPAVQDRLAMLAHRGLPGSAVLQLQVQREALVMSFEDGFRIAMVAILVGLALVAMLRKPREGAAAPAGAH
jgi:DHA2 family multidrug resistance protein